MNPAKQSSVPRHPMFRAMVVMGNGIAVGCGGVTTDQRGKVDTTGKDAGAGGSESASAGGISGTGGTIVIGSTGGTNPVGSGGATVIVGAGGTTTIGAGGGGGAAGAGGQSPACPIAQYDCYSVPIDCGQNNGGWTIPSCPCNPNRPLSAKECPAGTAFVCRKGTTTADGQPLDLPLPFECSCVAGPPSCTSCDTAFGSGGQMMCDLPGDGSVLCGCAIVVLR